MNKTGPLFGIEEVVIDMKCRFVVPYRFRPNLPPQLAIGLAIGDSGGYYLTLGSIDSCPGRIYEYPVKLDSQWRLCLPPALMRRAGLSSVEDAIILMRNKHLEIWHREAEIKEFLVDPSSSQNKIVVPPNP